MLIGLILKKALNIRFGQFYWIIPVLVILIYNLTFFNRYFAITEGWFSTYAWLFNHGSFPYRDFYFFLTPLYLVEISLFTSIFGYSILFLRIFGIGVILLMTYFLYKNFEIIFGAEIAAFVAIVGMIYYQSGVAHITYDFTQFVTLYGLIQSYFLLKYINTFDSKRNEKIKWVFWGGVFAGFAFITKQSNGLLIAVFSLIGLFLLSLPRGKVTLLKTTILYIAGFAVPVTIIILWLLSNSAFTQFKDQVFTGAVSAKGGLRIIFFSWLDRIVDSSFIKSTFILILLFFWGKWKFSLGRKTKIENNINKKLLIVSCIAILFVILMPYFFDNVFVGILTMIGSKLNYVKALSISVPIIWILAGIFLLITKKPFDKKVFLISLIAAGFIYGTGTSAGVSEAGLFIGFCIFLGLIFYQNSFSPWGKIIVIIFCISFSTMLAVEKYNSPYSWWNVTANSIREKLYTTNKIKILKGLYTSKENIKLIEEVTEEIKLNSNARDPVLTFPNIPIFNLLSERYPPGKALIYWFDFLPDSLALKEAEIIRKNPPKLIVYLDLGPSAWKGHELLFRGGKLSGQREFNATINDVIISRKMYISKKYNLANGAVLTLWSSTAASY